MKKTDWLLSGLGACVAVAFAILIGAVHQPPPVAKQIEPPAPTAKRWVLRVTYVDDVWFYKAPDRCDIGRQAIESNPDAIPDGMKRTVKCDEETD